MDCFLSNGKNTGDVSKIVYDNSSLRVLMQLLETKL